MKKSIVSPLVLSALWLGACASGGSPNSGETAATLPLAAYTQRALIVLPLQQFSELPGVTDSRTEIATAFKAAMNYEIPFAFGDAVPARWIFAQRAIEASKRSGGLIADPQKLSVEQFIERVPQPELSLSESLRTQVRQIVALTDARYVLLPVFVQLGGADSNGMRRATMRLVLIDSRLAQVRWAADIATEPMSSFGKAVASNLASRLALLAGLR